MQTPLILITSMQVAGGLSPRRGQSTLYAQCLEAAGALGTLYTGGNAAHIADMFDGLLLAGGGDILPARFGARADPAAGLSLDHARDQDEEALFYAFEARRKPILGICRGMQIINVFAGGSLHQHIEGHDSVCHKVTCTGDFVPLFGSATHTNSYHHQSVRQLAPPFTLGGVAADGCIEGFYDEKRPILGVQWHPERMVPEVEADITGESHLSAFEWLAARC